MEDSPNGKVDECKELVVEDIGDSKTIGVDSVKTLEIVDDDHGDDGNKSGDSAEPENKRVTSILEEIVEAAEKILGGDSSSSSSSSSDDEGEAGVTQVKEEGKEAAVCENEKEEVLGSEKLESCLVDNDGGDAVEDLVSIVETKLQTSHENDDGPSDVVLPCVDQETEAKTALAEQEEEEEEEQVSKGIQEKIGVSSEAVCEAPIEDVQSPQIPESTTSPSVVPVTRDSLQPTSWKSCCGLFEVFSRSER